VLTLTALPNIKRPLHEILSMYSARILVLSAVVGLLVLGLGTTPALGSTDGPKISGVEVINVAQTSATIAWITDSAGASQVNFGNAIDTLRFSVFDPALTTNHSAALTGLTPNTRYFLQVQVIDNHDKNIAEYNKGKYYSFTTLTSEEVPRAFAGLVVSGPTDHVTLYEQSTGELVKIILSENYALYTPGGLRAGTFQLGAKAVILGKPVDGNWVALSVLVKPLKPATPVTGVITRVKERVVTLTSSNGTAQTLTLPSKVNEVAIGDLVTVFPGPAGQAKGLVNAKKLRERLGKFLREIAESEEQDLKNHSSAKHAALLIRVLEKHLAHQEQIVDDVLRWASEDIQDEIRRKKTEIELFGQNSQIIKARVRAKFRLQDERDGGKGEGEGEHQQSQGNAQENKDQGIGQGQSQGSSRDNKGQGSNSGQGGGQENQGQGNNSGQGGGQENQGGGQENQGQGSNSGQGGGQENQGQGGHSGQGGGQENQGQGSNSGQGGGQENQGQGSNSGQGGGQENQGQGSSSS